MTQFYDILRTDVHMKTKETLYMKIASNSTYTQSLIDIVMKHETHKVIVNLSVNETLGNLLNIILIYQRFKPR